MLSHHRYLHRCHPIHARSGQKLSERSEGSLALGKEMLRCAQHDNSMCRQIASVLNKGGEMLRCAQHDKGDLTNAQRSVTHSALFSQWMEPFYPDSGTFFGSIRHHHCASSSSTCSCSGRDTLGYSYKRSLHSQ